MSFTDLTDTEKMEIILRGNQNRNAHLKLSTYFQFGCHTEWLLKLHVQPKSVLHVLHSYSASVETRSCPGGFAGRGVEVFVPFEAGVGGMIDMGSV